MAVTTNAAGRPRGRRRLSLLTRQDKLVLGLAVGIPAVVHIALVWIPTLASILLSLTTWNGIGGLDGIARNGATIEIGALTRHAQAERSRTHASANARIGSPAIRRRGGR